MTNEFVVSVVSHDSASKECKKRMGGAYELNRKSDGSVSEEALNVLRTRFEEDQKQDVKGKKRQKTIADWISPKQ